ncbi:MAG: FHA domain-containing protein [Clostridiales bacterium]|nr:FHA domain-containing protein [Clostridiales bacterium]
MRAEYRRDLQNNYLILEVPETNVEDGYGLRMAEQNQVKGLLPMHESRRDGKLFLHYEITSRQTLESVYEKKVMGYQDILAVLSGIKDTLENMRKYLLSPQKLLFAPELIYVLPEKKGLQLCYYAKEDEYPITMLAEFILKRLDHRDRQAVTLGYGFFQQANSANFSLTEALKEIFVGIRVPGEQINTDLAGSRRWTSAVTGDGATQKSELSRSGASMQNNTLTWENGPAGGRTFPSGGGLARGRRLDGGKESFRGSETLQGSRPENADGWNVCQKNSTHQDEEAEYLYDTREADEDEIFVTHRERKKQNNRPDLAERVFSRIHPAVLLSFLALMIGLELLFAFEILGLTETGGCFFLILSAEMLVNHRVLKKEQDGRGVPEWEDEENENYESIMQEVYRKELRPEPEAVEETRCLILDDTKEEFRLTRVCTGSAAEEQQDLQDIHPGADPIYIGKIKGEADIILHAPTVSRMHARIQIREGICYLKDMNSKNGTFVNGERLIPQEEREIVEGDRVSFANVEYRVVKD